MISFLERQREHSAWFEFVIRRRRYLLIIIHAILISLSFALAFLLRFEFTLPSVQAHLLWNALPWVVGIKLILFIYWGDIHGWWRYVTFNDLIALMRVTTLSLLALAAIDYFFVNHYQIPRSVLILDWGITVLLIGGLRSVSRMGREQFGRTSLEGTCAYMIGVDDGGEAMVRLLMDHPRLNYRIVGFLHHNPSYVGSRLAGIPFLGTPDQAAALATLGDVKHIIATSDALYGDQARSLLAQCRQAHIELKIIPSVDELFHEQKQLEIRDVNIEDLLRREPISLDHESISAMIRGKRVMVTGAGGSIGSEICRQILACDPERLVLCERAENSLYHIERELRTPDSSSRLVPCVADVRDRQRMSSVFRQHRPTIVFHAAAHKHVPLLEGNAAEALKNNVLGTKNLVELSDRFHVERFVMISTDKAVNPTSVMGVSKLLAERFVQSYSDESETRYVVVRFGNVLGSAGSVVPLFKEQIRNGGPVTITHPDMERYFMTIPEASQLVLEAAAMGEGGEIFLLDMGKPVKILDLAKDLIRLSGFTMKEIEVEFVGVRPGEKLYEELYFAEEESLPTPHPKLRVAKQRRFDKVETDALVRELSSYLTRSNASIRRKLRDLVPEFRSPTKGTKTPVVAPPSTSAATPDSGGVQKPEPKGDHVGMQPPLSPSPQNPAVRLDPINLG